MAQRPAGYRGQGFSLRGEKDRFVLPPAFRKVFADLGDDKTLCLIKHESYPCLAGFGLSRTENFEDLLDTEAEAALRRGVDFNRDLRSMQLWGFDEISFDQSGRFTLRDHVAKLGGLSEEIYFQGGGQFIYLWNPDSLYSMGAGFEGAQATCRALQEEATAKAKRK